MGRKPVKYANVKGCDDGDDGDDVTTVTATSGTSMDGFLWIKEGEPIKPKRRNGRLAWKPIALQAQYEARVMGWLAVAMSVLFGAIGFIAGTNY